MKRIVGILICVTLALPMFAIATTPLTTRASKGSALTYNEMDTNFLNLRSRIDNDLDVRLATVESSQNSSTIGYTTKSLMDADLAHIAGTIAVITNDATSSNNTYWIKLGPSGSGSWQKSAISPFLPFYSSRQFTTVAQAVAYIGSSADTVLRVSTPLTVAAGDSFPANISVIVDNGGVFVGPGSLICYGPVMAPGWAFQNLGGVTFSGSIASFGNLAGNKTATGADNFCQGEQACKSFTTGYMSLGLGKYALSLNTSGKENLAIGWGALRANTTAMDNMGIGIEALTSNTSGQFNVGLGLQALRINTTGSSNTATGFKSSFLNIEGSNNTSTGFMSGYNSLGSNNTSVGYQAGYNLGAANKNTCIGSNSCNSGTVTNISGSTVLGYNAQSTVSNALILGGTGDDAVNVGIGVTNPTKPLVIRKDNSGAVQSVGQFWNLGSSAIGTGISFDFLANRSAGDAQNMATIESKFTAVATSHEYSQLNFYTMTNGTFSPVISATGNAVTLSGDLLLPGAESSPPSGSSSCSKGTIRWDTNYIYVCVAVNTWKRGALTTW